MEASIQAAIKYAGQDLVSIVNNPDKLNDTAEVCQALNIKVSRQQLERTLEMAKTANMESLSKEHEKDSKPEELLAIQKKISGNKSNS